MPIPLAIAAVGAGLQVASAANKFIQAGKQRKLAKGITPVNTKYEENKAITNLYGEGKNLYQGRMAGATQQEQNILASGANTRAAVERTSTSGSQALAAAAGVQGSEQGAFADLGVREAQDKQNRFGIYSNVSQLMTQEGDKVYQDKLRNYYDDLNYKRGLEGAAMQNQSSGWDAVGDLGMAGISAAAGGLFGAGGGGRTPQLSQGIQRNMPNFTPPPRAAFSNPNITARQFRLPQPPPIVQPNSRGSNGRFF